MFQSKEENVCVFILLLLWNVYKSHFTEKTFHFLTKFQHQTIDFFFFQDFPIFSTDMKIRTRFLSKGMMHT